MINGYPVLNIPDKNKLASGAQQMKQCTFHFVEVFIQDQDIKVKNLI